MTVCSLGAGLIGVGETGGGRGWVACAPPHLGVHMTDKEAVLQPQKHSQDDVRQGACRRPRGGGSGDTGRHTIAVPHWHALQHCSAPAPVGMATLAPPGRGGGARTREGTHLSAQTRWHTPRRRAPGPNGAWRSSQLLGHRVTPSAGACTGPAGGGRCSARWGPAGRKLPRRGQTAAPRGPAERGGGGGVTAGRKLPGSGQTADPGGPVQGGGHRVACAAAR
jgi:hypothetical protein